MSLDAENFVDEGNKEAGMAVNVEVDEDPPVTEGAEASEAQQQQEQEAVKEPAAATETTAESSSGDETPERSFLVPEKAQEQETKETVPVYVAAELRAKNRDLKQQLEQAQTRPAGEKADVGADPLAGIEDDEFLTAGQVRKARVHDQAVAEQRRQEAEQQATQTVQQRKFEGFLLESEKKAKADHPDYTAVVTAAEDYMSPDDFQAALRTKNPAKVLYAKAKRTIAELGIEVQAPATTKQKKESAQEEEIIQTDDEVFTEVFPAT